MFLLPLMDRLSVGFHGRGISPSQGHYLHSNNSVALVRERTILTERPPLVGEVSDNFGE
jgi:hypothetical protein